MDPAVQLMLRVEREAGAQRRLYMAYRADLADEKPVRPPKRDNRIKRIFNPLRRRQRCECA